MATLLSHAQLGLQLQPLYADPAHLQLINPVSEQRAVVEAGDKLLIKQSGWAFLVKPTGEKQAVRNLLPAAVGKTADAEGGRTYVGFNAASRFIDEWEKVFIVACVMWATVADPAGTRTSYKWDVNVKGMYFFFDVRDWQEPSTVMKLTIINDNRAMIGSSNRQLMNHDLNM